MTECVSCKKKVSDDDEEVFAVFRCRKDHIFKCCKVECLRMFEKKCMKVSDNLIRVQHKLNNDGHTSALRRLPPSEREKLKQHAEAESLGMMICPEEVKASERSVPHCAHIMELVAGFGKDSPHGRPLASENDSSPTLDAGGELSEHPRELLDDDMLLEIKRDNDDLDDELPGGLVQKTRKKKQQSQKKGQALLIDWKTSSSADEPAAKAATRNPGGIGAAQQAWSAVAARGVETSAVSGPGSLSSRKAEVRGERAERALPQDAEARMGQAEKIKSAQGSAPSRPALPPVPEGWQAVWNEEHKAYYYWHVPTNETSWEAPKEASDDQAPPSKESMIARVQGETRLHEAAARLLLESSAWDVETALRSHARAVQEAARRKEEEEEAARRKAEEEALRLAARRRAEEEAAARAREEAERAAEAAKRCSLGHGVCMRNFRPAPGLEDCLCLNQGDQVKVTWTDEQPSGWAYGLLIDDAGQEGYFPQDIIRRMVRPSRHIQVGEALQAVEPYKAPPGTSGYLSLSLGEIVTVLHTDQDRVVWVYAERQVDKPGITPQRGWVPETSLDDAIKSKHVMDALLPSKGSSVQVIPRPHPAG